MKVPRISVFVISVLIGLAFSADALCKRQEVNLGDKSPSEKKEKLIWNVNRQITGFRIEIKAGRPIINTIKLLGSDTEFTVGAYVDTGQKWEKLLAGPTHVGQLRVNVDKARGSTLRLVVYTSGTSSSTGTATIVGKAASGQVDMGTYTPSEKKEKLIWNVNRQITGFRVEIKSGQVIINTVKFLGGEGDWTVGRYLNAGENYEVKLPSSTHVGQIRVNVDKAKGDKIKLVVYTGYQTSESTDTDDDDGDIKIRGLNKDAEKKVDDMFKGLGF
jgi:hypothetical protein